MYISHTLLLRPHPSLNLDMAVHCTITYLLSKCSRSKSVSLTNVVFCDTRSSFSYFSLALSVVFLLLHLLHYIFNLVCALHVSSTSSFALALSANLFSLSRFFGTLVSISVFQLVLVLVLVLLQLLWEVPEQNDSVFSSYLSCPSFLMSTLNIVLSHCNHVLALSNDVNLFEHLHFLVKDTLKKEDFQEHLLEQTFAKCPCTM